MTHVSEPERAALRHVEDWGLTDVFRRFNDPGVFSWWDYRAGDFHQGRGMRIDLVLLSADLAARATGGLDRTGTPERARSLPTTRPSSSTSRERVTRRDRSAPRSVPAPPSPAMRRRRSSASPGQTSERGPARPPWSAARSSARWAEPAAGRSGPRWAAGRSAALGRRPAAPQLLLGPGEGHVEQPALLVHGRRRLGRGDGASGPRSVRRSTTVCHCSPLARWNVVRTTRSSVRPPPRPARRRGRLGGDRAPLGRAGRSPARGRPRPTWQGCWPPPWPPAPPPAARWCGPARRCWTTAARGCGTAWPDGRPTRPPSASLGWATTAAPGRRPGCCGRRRSRARTVSSDSPSRSTAVATATTWGEHRWFSSSRMTRVPRRISGSR